MMWAYYKGSDSNSSEYHDEDLDEAEGEEEVDSAEKKRLQSYIYRRHVYL